MPVDKDAVLNGTRDEALQRPDRKPTPKTDRLIPINDASTGMSVALRETATRHKQQLERFRSAKQTIARQVAQAYADEIRSFDSDVAAALVTELGGVDQTSNPFSFDLNDIWESPSNPLSDYQPKYLNGATAD